MNFDSVTHLHKGLRIGDHCIYCAYKNITALWKKGICLYIQKVSNIMLRSIGKSSRQAFGNTKTYAFQRPTTTLDMKHKMNKMDIEEFYGDHVVRHESSD